MKRALELVLATAIVTGMCVGLQNLPMNVFQEVSANGSGTLQNMDGSRKLSQVVTNGIKLNFSNLSLKLNIVISLSDNLVFANFTQLHTNSLMVARAGSVAEREKDVFLTLNVRIAPSENAYSLQRQKMQRDFLTLRDTAQQWINTLRCVQNVDFVRRSSQKPYKQT